jgi:hypothetical protein
VRISIARSICEKHCPRNDLNPYIFVLEPRSSAVLKPPRGSYCDRMLAINTANTTITGNEVNASDQRELWPRYEAVEQLADCPAKH